MNSSQDSLYYHIYELGRNLDHFKFENWTIILLKKSQISQNLDFEKFGLYDYNFILFTFSIGLPSHSDAIFEKIAVEPVV